LAWAQPGTTHRVIKNGRVKAILAKSVARISSDAINLGLPILICNTEILPTATNWK